MLAPVIARVPQLPGSGLVRRTLAQRQTQEQIEAGAQAHIHRGADDNCHTHGRPEEYTAARSKLKLASERSAISLLPLTDLRPNSFRVLSLARHAQIVPSAQPNGQVAPSSRRLALADLN